ncbi:MAG: CBS domain-containing protein [Burkholderiales bacterium]|jgi:acetoin utilization protein AcuB|nr:CBS domain-containing protein [Burkholderiales bacterium]
MIVRNWMKPTPVTVTGDMLLSDASRIFSESSLHGLPVVEDGRLRGLITRANCLRAAHFVARTQSPDEFAYFSNRLRVRDIMVRKPATVDANDTMEACLQKGQELNVGQFPVMDGDRVVGLISANEIFALAAHFLGAFERRSGVTLAPMVLDPGTIGRVTDIVESHSGEVIAIYPIGVGKPPAHLKKLIVRFHGAGVGAIVAALEEAGYSVIESVENARSTVGQSA